MWKKLSVEKFDEVFDNLWNDPTLDTFVKLEVLQDYEEDHNNYYDMFLNRNLEVLRKELRKLWQVEDIDFNWQRVHLVNLPLSEYLQFEIECYRIWQEMGVKVYFQTFDNIKKIIKKPIFEDFMLFDDKCIIVNKFNKNQYSHSKLSFSKGIIMKYLNFKNELMSNVIEMDEFLKMY